MYKQFVLAGLLIALQVLSESEALQDPTRPPTYSPSITDPVGAKIAENSLHLELDAILKSDLNALAIINNATYTVGDTVGTYKIKAIESYRVVLAGPEGEVVLHLFGHPIKEPLK